MPNSSRESSWYYWLPASGYALFYRFLNYIIRQQKNPPIYLFTDKTMGFIF